MTKTFGKARCFVCGEETILEHIEFEEWTCSKDRQKILKYIMKLKNRANKHTRYKDAKSFIAGHKLEE